MSDRDQLLQDWVSVQLPRVHALKPLSGDASFRRYWRAHTDEQAYVVMDAPPTHESVTPFIAIAKGFRQHGILAPEILAENIEQGFLMLSDFGDQLLLSALQANQPDSLYQQAFQSLLRIQSCPPIQHYSLHHYDAALYRRELDLFCDWYLARHLQIALTTIERDTILHVFSLLIEDALAQPQVCVHRDYHSRNLMVLPKQTLGVLDFQDAVIGPVTYDLVSLLRDCYIDWPPAQVEQWVNDYYRLAKAHNIVDGVDAAQFKRWFDWMGLQRHLKCIGIFARLNWRDHKPSYLNNIPRILQYVQQVCRRYPEFTEFLNLMTKKGLI